MLYFSLNINGRQVVEQWQIFIIIPVLNEEASIAKVIGDIPKLLEAEIIPVIVDNGSTDDTPNIVKEMGVVCLHEPVKGYGRACQRGLAHAQSKLIDKAWSIAVVLDGDYSDYPEDLISIVRPIMSGSQDFVMGSRTMGRAETGSLGLVQKWGNQLATRLIKWRYGFSYTDMGPFRALYWPALEAMKLEDLNFGWNVEMQVKALKLKLRVNEVPVRYRKRIGKSKISGTVKGVFQAGFIIIKSIFKYG